MVISSKTWLAGTKIIMNEMMGGCIILWVLMVTMPTKQRKVVEIQNMGIKIAHCLLHDKTVG